MPNDFYAELLVNEFFKVKDVVTTTQYIFNLKIVPGVDFVKVSFETLQPTIPVITCTASDGSVAFAFPLFGGMRTKHVGILGEHKPLQQDTPHTLKIVAAGTNRHGQRIEKQVTTNFRTGSREATVMFDTIKVRNDSDTSSNGELRLFFSVGDLESGAIIGQPLVWPYLDISDRDQPFDMNLSTVIPRAPRRLWVSVNAFDDDNNPLFPSFDQFTEEYLQAFTSFKGEGSTGGSNSSYDWANITRVFDIDSIGAFASSDQTFRIDLPTAKLRAGLHDHRPHPGDDGRASGARIASGALRRIHRAAGSRPRRQAEDARCNVPAATNGGMGTTWDWVLKARSTTSRSRLRRP